MNEMWILISRLLSKITPSFLAQSDGDKVKFRIPTEKYMTFDRCCGVPINNYSVLDGLIDRRFVQNQKYFVQSGR